MTNRTILTFALTGSILLTACAQSQIAEPPATPQKTEVRHSMMGFRSTLIFYHYRNKNVVLRVEIGNQNSSFPLKTSAYSFDPSVSAEGVKKWINNQHSDARYPDVPQAKMHPLKDHGKVESYTKKGENKIPGPVGGNYQDFEVSFSLPAIQISEKVSLPALKDKAMVHVRQ